MIDATNKSPPRWHRHRHDDRCVQGVSQHRSQAVSKHPPQRLGHLPPAAVFQTKKQGSKFGLQATQAYNR